MTTVKELFGLPQVIARDMKTAADRQPPDPTLIYGIELEIECASPDWGDQTGWSATEDGSLRNDGWEFISNPATFNTLVHRINRFFTNIEGFNPAVYNHYTERTSTHVHTNCQDLTLEQLSTILLLYQVTEDLLFKFVGEDRADNIFCVPWSQTQITYRTVSNIKQFISTTSIDRNKYTALNLVRLRDIGTIEWRHMPGHSDVFKIEQWLRIIGHYYRIARLHTLQEVQDKLINLNSSSQYDWLMDWLFKEQATSLRFIGYRQMLENGVLTMKYSLMDGPSTIKPTLDQRLIEEILQSIQMERVRRQEVNTTEGSF